ncbi:hypothetical protein CTAYLR_002829 [Chrysophaeum taylorii]|uniref:Large ribosomal subunit protein bL20c n=1 Tax=Chrysophaeum taylorii TaxID=2483200 RepID=A0AAD7U827_9STRA|nr:hypothetical protein CTAYLR_002829 [Chrysophaeum taylorii]
MWGLRSVIARPSVTSLFTGVRFASNKHKKFVKWAKGYRGRANRCFRIAVQRVEKAWQHAYRSRRVKKRDMRRLWITRINAATRAYDVPYNRFIAGLSTASIHLNRKVLSDLAMTEPFSFRSVVDVTRSLDPYLANKPKKQPLFVPEEEEEDEEEVQQHHAL